jgi:hypothetical protein
MRAVLLTYFLRFAHTAKAFFQQFNKVLHLPPPALPHKNTPADSFSSAVCQKSIDKARR